MPKLLTQGVSSEPETGRSLIGIVAGFKSERWPDFDRNGGRLQIGIRILKSRCKKAGFDPKLFSAHGLRSGFLTEAASRGIPLPDAIQQSLHRSVNQAARYYSGATSKQGRED